MAFKIEVRDGEKLISFGPRYPGQIGKDILAVKVALGIVTTVAGQVSAADQDPNDAPEENSPIPLDRQGWFDCATGLGIDIQRASTFDDSLQRALTRYQIENRFLITSYLFQTFGVRSLISSTKSKYASDEEIEKYSQSIAQQLFAIDRLFESEYGLLGEATMAVMHGWRPHSVLQNIGFNHQPTKFSEGEFAVDIIPEVLFEDYRQGLLGQTPQSMIDEGIVPEVHAYSNSKPKLRQYKLKASSEVDWIKVKRSQITPSSDEATAILTYGVPYRFGSIDYIVRLNQRSILYSASIRVMELEEEFSDNSLIPAEDRRERMKRFFYPDPFSNPDPFYINDDEIGFFDETPFFLSPDGPIPSEDPEVIAELEEAALQKVLEFYNKPEIWYFLKDDFEFASTYFGSTSVPAIDPPHTGVFPRAIDPATIEKTAAYKLINSKIFNKEQAIERLRKEIESTTIHTSVFPVEFESPTAYKAYVQRKISTLNREIEELRNELELIKNPSPEFKKEMFYPFSTKNIIDQAPQGSLYSWRASDSAPNRLISFVEYRTPSLRPEQSYRAFYIINKRKLDLITAGESLVQTEPPRSNISNTDPSEVDNDDQACLDQNTEQAERTYEEYRIHAQKKRREIVRALRERVEARERQSTNGSWNVSNFDLPTVGPFDLDAAFTSVLGLNNLSNDEDYTRAVIRLIAEGVDDFGEFLGLNDDFEEIEELIKKQETGDVSKGVDHIKISLYELDQRIDQLAKDLSKASAILENEGITFARGSNFDSENESRLLRVFRSELVEMINGFNEANNVQSIDELDPRNIGLRIVFKKTTQAGLGPKAGKYITDIYFDIIDDSYVGIFLGVPIQKEIPAWVYNDAQPDLVKIFKRYETLNRSRTVNYISNIIEITNPYPSSAGDFILSFFDDKANACAGLFGTDTQKNIAISLVGAYTSGLSVNRKEEEELSDAFKNWGKKHFVEPFNLWWETSAKNASDSLEDTFDEEQALRSLGKMCTLEDLYEEFIDKIDLLTLLCNYLECIKLPGFSLKLPNMHLPPFPKIPIIGWYAGLLDFLINNMRQILVRILCTFVRTIIDKLAFPFCEEQLQEFIAAGSSATPLMNEALVSALTNTGIPRGKESEAKKLFEDTSKITTGQELCYLLGGKQLDEAGMQMLKRLVRNRDLADSLDTSEAISNFFGVVGSYLPFEFCQQLAEIETPMAMSCKDAADSLLSIRNRLQSGDGTLQDSEINAAMELADKNLREQKESLESFSGSNIYAMLPENLKPNSSNIILSQMPEILTEQLKVAANALFEPARMAYMTNLSSFVAGMQSQVQDVPVAGDREYNDIEVLRLETALEQLKNYSYKLARTTDQDKQRYDRQKQIQIASIREQAVDANLKIPDSVLSFESLNITTYYAQALKGVYIIDQIMSSWEWLRKYGNSDSIPEAEDLLGHYDETQISRVASEEDFALLNGFVHALMGYAFRLPDDSDSALNRRGNLADINIHNNYDFERILQSGIWSANNGAYEQSPDRPYVTTDENDLRILGLPKEEFQRVESETAEDRAQKDFYDPRRGNISWWHYPLSPEGFVGSATDPFFAPFWNPTTWSSIGSPEASSQVNIVDFYFTEEGRGIGIVDQEDYNSLGKLGDYSPLRSTEIQELIPLSAITPESKVSSGDDTDPSVVFRTSRIEAEDVSQPSLAFLAYSSSSRRYWRGIETAEDNVLSKSAILNNYFDNENPWYYKSWIQNFHIDYLISAAESVSADEDVYGQAYGLNDAFPVVQISSPRKRDNVSLKDKTKKMLSHEFLIGARNYLIRSLVFLKDFIDQKKEFQNIIFERFNGGATGGELYETLSEQQRADSERNQAARPIIYPDDLRVLYQVYEVEKYPIPKENRTPGDRKYHWVHKKYKVNSYEGLAIENDLVEIGKEIVSSTQTPYSVYIKELKDSFKVNSEQSENVFDAPPGTYALKPMRAPSDYRHDGINYIIDNGSNGTPTTLGNDDNRSTGLAKSDFFRYFYSARNLHPALKASSPFESGIDPDLAKEESVEVNHIISLDPDANSIITAFGQSGIGQPYLVGVGGDEDIETKTAIAMWLNDIDNPRVPNVQSTAVLKVAMERVEYLTSTIIEIMNQRPNIVQEKHLAIVKEVLERTNNNRSVGFGHINYSCIPDRPEQAFNLSSGNYKGELMNIEFTAAPYTPSIKMVELLTKDETQDRYNIVIDSDTFIHQGFRSPEGNYLEYESSGVDTSYYYGKTPGDSRLNEESLLILDQYETPSRKIMKFCDPLPAEMVASNDPIPEKGDFSKREAFAKMMRNSLESSLGGNFSAHENAIKRSVFKLNTKSIFSELMSSIQYSAMFLPDYARELDKRLSSRPYVIPGTRCVKNRYGFIESSLLAFDRVILGDMTAEITQEISKPENSPWNRSFNDISPFDKAARKIAVKAHIRVCLVELLLKGALAYSVWDMESIVSEPSVIEYAYSKIYHELNVSPSLREHWPAILEDATGIDNKSQALYSVIREEIVKLPAYSRQVFNPGEGHKDFYNWYIYGRTLERYNQPQDEQVQNSFFTPEGLFKRLPVPSDVVVPLNPAASPDGLDFTWKIRDYSGKSFLSEMSSFKRRVTRASVDATSQSGQGGSFNSHDHVSEFIFEDYVRINGEILNYYTEPRGALVQGIRGCPPTEMELRIQQVCFKIESFFQSFVSLFQLAGADVQAFFNPIRRDNPASYSGGLYATDLFDGQTAVIRQALFDPEMADRVNKLVFVGNQDRDCADVGGPQDTRCREMAFYDNDFQRSFNNTYYVDRYRYLEATRQYIPNMHTDVLDRFNILEMSGFSEELQAAFRGDAGDLASIGYVFAKYLLEIQQECEILGLNIKISPNAWALAEHRPRQFEGRPEDIGGGRNLRAIGVEVGFEDYLGWLPMGGIINHDAIFSEMIDYIERGARMQNYEDDPLGPAQGLFTEEETEKILNILQRNYSIANARREGIVPSRDIGGYDQYDPARYTSPQQPDEPTMTLFQFGDPNAELFYKGSYRYSSNNNLGSSSFTGEIDDGTNNIEKYQRMVTSYEYQPPNCQDAPNYDPVEEGLYIEQLGQYNQPVVISIQEFNDLIERLKDDPDESLFQSVLSNSGVSQGIRLTQIVAGDAVGGPRERLWINPLIKQMWESPNIVEKTITERAYAINLGNFSSYEGLRREVLRTWMRRNCSGNCNLSAAREIGLAVDEVGFLEPMMNRDTLERESTLVFNGLGLTWPQDEITTFSGLEDFVIDELAAMYSMSGMSEIYAASIPLVSYEEDICDNIIESGIDFQDPEVMNAMSEKLAEQQEFKYIMEHMFPIRRFMAMTSMHSTAILGGYGQLPKLFAPTKAKLGILAHYASTPPNLKLNSQPLTQSQFAMDIKNNFPGSPDDPACFGFPPFINGEFLEAFWEELKQLIEDFPSVLFRGLANTMDPAYKEMRAHFLNCDIENLNWTGINYSGAKDGKLVNGLKLSGPPRTKSGKYTPLILGAGADLVFAFEDFPYKLPSRFGKMLARVGSYIYSGNLPFIDPSGFFRIPCIEYDESWKENERWDFGIYGRYGHPLSPITAIALTTKQLRADLDKRNNNCPDEEVDLDCEDIS